MLDFVVKKLDTLDMQFYRSPRQSESWQYNNYLYCFRLYQCTEEASLLHANVVFLPVGLYSPKKQPDHDRLESTKIFIRGASPWLVLLQIKKNTVSQQDNFSILAMPLISGKACSDCIWI